VGDGGASDRRLPRAVRNRDDSGPLKGVAAVTTGQSHSCALLAIGQVR
jgi:hypothetical protein